MLRSEMNNDQKSKHTEVVCKLILAKKKANKVKIDVLESQIRDMQKSINVLNENTKDYSIDVCEREEISFKFIDEILFGKPKKKVKEKEDGESI